MRKTGPDKATRELVWARAKDMCEQCGVAPAEQAHHRRPRGIGGTRDPAINYPSNLLALCFPCHSHTEANREWALYAGFLVSRLSSARTSEVAVHRRGQWVLLDDFGGIEPIAMEME